MQDKKITVRANDDLLSKLQDLAKRNGLDASSQVRMLIHKEHQKVFSPRPVETGSRITDVES